MLIELENDRLPVGHDLAADHNSSSRILTREAHGVAIISLSSMRLARARLTPEIHLLTIGLAVGSGGAGEIAKVTQVLKVFARFSVSMSLLSPQVEIALVVLRQRDDKADLGSQTDRHSPEAAELRARFPWEVNVASMLAPRLPGAASTVKAAWPPSTDRGEV
jgi:hypothetical protein